MSPQAQTVFDAAMALPMEDRADLARALGEACRPLGPPPMTGAELVAYLHEEGLIGNRPEVDATPGSRLGFAPGSVAWMSDDFDAELPPEFWLGGFP